MLCSFMSGIGLFLRRAVPKVMMVPAVMRTMAVNRDKEKDTLLQPGTNNNQKAARHHLADA